MVKFTTVAQTVPDASFVIEVALIDTVAVGSDLKVQIRII